MINPNLTELANLTETFDATPMIISGTINGSQPVLLSVSGNVSAIVSQPSYTMMLTLNIVQTFMLTIILIVILTWFYIDVSRRKRL